MEVLRLKELLKEKKINGKQLAGLVQVTEASVSNIVNGNSFPKPELLLKIADVLNVDVKELFNSTKEVNKEKIYIKKGSDYIVIGELNKNQNDAF